MEKLGLLTGLLLVAGLTFAQVTKLEETTVEPPKFVGQQIMDSDEEMTSSPICYYLKNNLQSQNYSEEGVVTVLFTINPDGTLSNFTVKNSVDATNDNAVLNCLKSTSGLWQAGRVNGTPVEMEKEIYVHFVNPSTTSLEELAQENIMAAINKVETAKNVKNSIRLSAEKANKKATRKLHSALYYLDEATKYQPEEASIIFWQACAYDELGNEIRRAEKLNQFMEMVDLQYQAQVESVSIFLN
ncbi:energy transducer TonB [Plebeiibacterium sediminum]|uniref:Energy transducer TonB n=1 Tax=Plebeiibacterium sediminum TaxID=2992112 RepID=A0AAE3SH10_9BACT|nr:energy transducer TonB [Plebeiobacterium sediminum]MCW3789075.1 energy transducer TonB [Plebeiobacterium sediminum]